MTVSQVVAAAVLALRGAAAAVVGVDAHGGVDEAERWRTQNRTALRAALLENYDATDLPPVVSSSRGVLVNVQTALQQVTDIDTRGQTMALFAWWRHNWVDARLAWDPADWGGVSVPASCERHARSPPGSAKQPEPLVGTC